MLCDVESICSVIAGYFKIKTMQNAGSSRDLIAVSPLLRQTQPKNCEATSTKTLSARTFLHENCLEASILISNLYHRKYIM
jgi:hypothetical protein